MIETRKWAMVSLCFSADERPRDWPSDMLGEGRLAPRTGVWVWSHDFWQTDREPVDLQLSRLTDYLDEMSSVLAGVAREFAVRISWTPVDSQHGLAIEPRTMALISKLGCWLAVDTYMNESLADEEMAWRRRGLPPMSDASARHVYLVVRNERFTRVVDSTVVSCWSSEDDARREAQRLESVAQSSEREYCTYEVVGTRWMG